MIKSIVINATGTTFYMDSGDVLQISAANSPSSASIIQMLDNIRRDGFSPFIGGSTDLVSEILDKLGLSTFLDPTGIERIPLETGSVPLKPLVDMINHAGVTNHTEPLQALLNRIAKVDRQHSQDDLVAFINAAQMPITNDGHLLAYKLVNKDNDGNNFDVHSNTVKNNVGSKVKMDIKRVDPNRAVDCSYGLHVASRDYLRTFQGNTLLLIKVAPEDVIAVPQYSPTKVRVCAYEVLHEFTSEQMNHILSRQALNEEVWGIIKPFLKGNSIPISEVVTAIENGHTTEAVSIDAVESSSELPEAYAQDIKKPKDVPLTEIIQQAKTTASSLYAIWFIDPTEENYQALLNFKRSKKQSWIKLGLTSDQIYKLEN